MNYRIKNLRIPVEKDYPEEYVNAVSEQLQISADNVKFVKMLHKSLDARNKKQFFYEISIVVSITDVIGRYDNITEYVEREKKIRKKVSMKDRPIIVGFGPAGIFAALELIEYGLKPIIFERGKKIADRSIDVKRFIKERVLDPESNIQFGEGGAGSYSDGKLFSRIRNSEYINKVLDTYMKFGAPEEIGYAAKPHLGTDLLCKIVVKIRKYIIEKGGEIYYSSKVTDLIISDAKITGVVINDKQEYHSSLVFMAVGHSARDTFEMIHSKGVFIEQRPIAVGVRIEHPVEIINQLRYGNKYKDFPGLGAANYSFTYNDKKIGRGVFTFCMCPGGEIVNASSENGLMVVNGMSYSARSSAFSNSAIVVTCRNEDYNAADPLAGIRFQKDIERRAFNAGGKRWEVPAQNLLDFLSGRKSVDLNKNSCRTGVFSADMKEIFPKLICDMLSTAFSKWKEEYPLFVSEHAILLAAETRTSCPLRMTRNEKYESLNTANLYPIGEGSGYTGGITSSAADAIRAVRHSLMDVE